ANDPNIGSLGIDLFDNVVTPNDPNDTDGDNSNSESFFANHLQNFPVITGISEGLNTTLITGSFNSTPNNNYRIEFFTSDARDPSGFGEGKTLLGAIDTL